jgi:hypothetical protein
VEGAIVVAVVGIAQSQTNQTRVKYKIPMCNFKLIPKQLQCEREPIAKR